MYEGPIEGFDWDEDRIHKEIDHYLEQLKGGLPDRDDLQFWVYYKEPQSIELNQRLALYRIRASEEEMRNLEDAELRRKCPSLEDEHYFVLYENHLDWYFDPVYCKFARLQDYQRIVLRDYGEYEEWEDYRRTCNSLEGDQQFVQFWDDLQKKTKWLIECVKADRCVEYLWTVRFETSWLNYYVEFFLTIVFPGKTDFKEALRKVYEGGKHYPLSSSELKRELDGLDSDGISVPGLCKEVTKPALLKLVERLLKARPILTHKTYYDYAKKKLEIAKEIGLIMPY
ncbi:hypothetical protein EJB05_04375, partial [Eragrostis curvula]